MSMRIKIIFILIFVAGIFGLGIYTLLKFILSSGFLVI